MKRVLLALALFAALSLGSIGAAAAHEITVIPPGGGVGTSHDLAKGTPRHFPDGDDPGTAPDSAASQGTNTACAAIPAGGPVTITGGSC